MDLIHIGWHPYFEAQFNELQQQIDAPVVPGRISTEHRERYEVLCADGDIWAQVSGKFRHDVQWRSDFPAVGDWVAVEPQPGDSPGVIHAVLPRRTAFIRKAELGSGKTDNQALATNVDTVFIVSSLNEEFNLRRIERYLTIAWDSGVKPVIVLNKSDVCETVDDHIAKTESVAIGVPIHAISALDDSELTQLQPYMSAGTTVAFIGSSGVGKSTIINRLLGYDRQSTGEIRVADGKGRHTTTTRELIVQPGGAILVDTPGMRLIGLWSDDSGLEQTFEDIEGLATACKFRDCSHADEPGCAIQAAIESGELDAKRFASYLRLQREIAHMERRKDKAAMHQLKREWQKRIQAHHKAMKELRKRGLR
ncbi:ribosome small subunit-dependent GTPase A [candidate division GN15 bacterium]|nr:ribosome small subunit-dependent GTPase A [candidate division GN15 bacterium]